MPPRRLALRLDTSRPTGITPIHHFPHTDETADREHLCARDDLYQTIRERQADPIHIWVATDDDIAILKFGPCPHKGIIESGSEMVRFELPVRRAVHFHPDCVPPNLRPIDDPG